MTTEYMLYLYDGEGRRVAKVSNPTFSCTPGTGSTLMETYLLGPSGEHITELRAGRDIPAKQCLCQRPVAGHLHQQ